MVSLGTPPFSASSSWNTPIPDNATFTNLNWPTSTGYNYSVAWDSYSPSVYVASASDPVVQVTYPPGWGYPGGTVSVHMPAAANGAAGTDGELIVIDGDVAYNFWQFNRTSTTTATAASFGAENVVTGDGWGSKSPFLSAGTTAVGSSELGGLLVKAEADDGSIDHALQLVVDAKLVKSGAVGSAISSDGSSATGIVQEGELLAIPPDMPMPAGLSPLGQEVFKAMQKYGAYVVDVAGGVTNIRAQANAFDDATITALWHDMGQITPLLEAVSASGTSSSGSTSGTTTGTGGTTSSGGTTTGATDPTNSGGGTSGTPVITPPASSTTDTTKPTLAWIAANADGLTNGNGAVRIGDTVYLTLKFSEAVNVAGTPSLSLNDKGTAKYVSGSGTDTLQFTYTVGAGQNTSDLAISQFNLSGVKDLAGNALNLSGAPRQPAGTLVVDTVVPKVNWISATGSGIRNGNGTVHVGDTIRLSVNFNEAMTVNSQPSLSLNSNGTARYVSGSGTSTLQFDYTVGAGDNTSDLAVSKYNLNGVVDQAGNTVNLSGAPLQPAGTLAVRTAAVVTTSLNSLTAPTASAVTALAVSPTTSANTASAASSAGASQMAELSFGHRRTLGYSGSHEETGSAAPADRSVASKLALLSQYSASSFATNAVTSTANPAQGHWGDTANTLAKPHG